MNEIRPESEAYAEPPEYNENNEAFMGAIDLDGVRRVADLACSTGLMSETLLGRDATLAVCGVDIDSRALEIARRDVGARGIPLVDLDGWRKAGDAGTGAFCAHQGSADELPFADGEIDLAVMGNAVHLMPDRAKFFAEVHRVLRPGGQIAFNSAFFVGTYPSGTEHIWSEWMKEALLVMGERNEALKAEGQPPVPRKRGTTGRAFTKGWIDGKGWCDLLEHSGFTDARFLHREMKITAEGLGLLASHDGLPEQIMSGYPVGIASECLREAAPRTYTRLGIETVPRDWLEVYARKPS